MTTSKEFVKPKWKGCRCNILDGAVKGVYMEGSAVRADIVLGDVNLKAEVSPDYLEEFDVKPGSAVLYRLEPQKLKCLRNVRGFKV